MQLRLVVTVFEDYIHSDGSEGWFQIEARVYGRAL